MKLSWTALADDRTADGLAGAWIEIEGWMAGMASAAPQTHFALVAEPACCNDCLPRSAKARIEVFTDEPVLPTGHALRLAGRWCVLQDDAAGWRYQLREARLLPSPVHNGFTRRAALAAGMAGGVLAGLSAWLPDATAAPDEAALAVATQALGDAVTVDLHSHAGSIGGLKRIQEQAPFTPVADPMRAGRMAVICLAMVADTPAIRTTEDKRIRPFRDPAPGELYAYAQQAFGRLHGMVKAQKLGVITDAASMKAAHADRPSVIVAAEGGDFLEGNPDRLDEACEKWKLRHLQLTHYRVNELGDIQTEDPVHGGLTAAGATMIRRCNERGVIVDIAHGTYDLVKRAVDVTTKPLVLSHTSLTMTARPYTRLILPNHAKLVAKTGGVIGVWPPTTIFTTMDEYAAGIARLVDLTSIDNVGLGSDMQGLLSPSIFPSYRQLPALAAALMARGFRREDMLKLLGGNYLRVALATLS
ncbi:MAG: membrane dipeptidase [Ferrovibrio sp.]|uniref:dipeptidase n=1 Tax=Ferrovibrio sp. TaxID=1917215 RepID=UPI0026354889|nr:membrane dipeptidase [Ferrovibrio sp.]MCW0233161.1 membrane dipeptidase [Ferrovibrio sp.]